MAESQFDVENALLADARLRPMLPHDIPRLVENEADEQEDIVPDPAPARPAPTVPQTGVGQGLEGVPGTHQLPPLNNLADLALDLANFQEADRRRILGDSSQAFSYNRREEIIPALNTEDYMHSESDEEYLQDEDEDEDEENKGDSVTELDPGLPPPANDASRGASPTSQMQEAEHGVHGEHRSERPYLTTLEFTLDVLEVVAEVQYYDLDLEDQAAEPVNTRELVPPQHSPTSSNEVLSTELQGPNADPIPVIEEGHVHEIFKHVNPSSSGILTLAASAKATPLLPGTSDAFVLCESTLEPATSSSAGKGRIAAGVPVQKPGAADASVSEGESVLEPAV